MHRYTHNQNVYVHFCIYLGPQVVQDHDAVCTRALRLNKFSMFYASKFSGIERGVRPNHPNPLWLRPYNTVKLWR